MIKTSHAIGVTMLTLFLITGYFDSMLDDMRTEIFTLKEQLDKKDHSAWGTLEFNVTVTIYLYSVALFGFIIVPSAV